MHAPYYKAYSSTSEIRYIAKDGFSKDLCEDTSMEDISYSTLLDMIKEHMKPFFTACEVDINFIKCFKTKSTIGAFLSRTVAASTHSH